MADSDGRLRRLPRLESREQPLALGLFQKLSDFDPLRTVIEAQPLTLAYAVEPHLTNSSTVMFEPDGFAGRSIMRGEDAG